jgi:hypothetical protein
MKNIVFLKLILPCLFLINLASGQTIVKNESQTNLKSDVIKNVLSEEVIDYHRKGIVSFPSEILEMSELKQVDLSNNRLTEVPAEIKNLKSLRILNLSGNKIYELPSDISRLKFLKEIYLDREIWQYRLNEVKKITSAKIYLVG